jgi:hypothetical protein
MPPETRYFLASVILYSGDYYIGLSLDVRNSHGIHISYDGMYGVEKGIQVIRLEDPIQNSIGGFCIYELWYVKAIPPTVGTITTSKIPPLLFSNVKPQILPMLSTNVKPVGIHNFGNTCYLNTLVQIIFWVVPIRKRLIEYKLSKKDLNKIPPVFLGELEFDPVKLHKGLGLLKKLLVNMRASMTKRVLFKKTR